MDNIGSAMAIMDQKRQIGGFAQVSYSASFLDWSTGEFGLHKLSHRTVVGGLLGSLSLRDLSRGNAIGRVDGDSRLGQRLCKARVSGSLGLLRLVGFTAIQQSDTDLQQRCSTYLPSSLDLARAVRFRLGIGMRHSIENATQLVHGTLISLVANTRI